ncbi:HEXXH motif-containing putative peptide modification protein [Actinoplanes sp. L3-i22]|uniref:aKG-HExxH-type peptide beta-hydroxylase n=1 Tax=Actinoplanes sp. L3-i22 TaxID=2836373 RepID=UPI001C77BFCD|nr:HEXXH motif-containing putative peptide modification protein [Actinoplanes sp. L3-i22]BCY08603.1 HEXXH motif domain-containing protein [Actinoplanes sp. L3-i22]
MTGVHRIAPPALTALASASPVLAGLGPARLSRHLVQIRALADQVRASAAGAGERAGLDGSLAALVTIQRAAEGPVAELLGAPEVGAWSAWCLRRLFGTVSDAEPLVTDLAHLGALAVTAAVITGRRAEVVVPVRAGWLVLPSLGRFRVTRAPGSALARARRDDSGLTVDGPDGTMHLAVERGRPAGAGWEPMHRVRLDADPPVGLVIDDITPYRRLYGYPASDRLPPEELDLWRDLVHRAWHRLRGRHRPWATAFGRLISVLAPLAPRATAEGISSTARDSIGAIALTRPVDPRELAVTFVHELQHNYVNILHDIGPLFRAGGAERLYSPWRDDPRPVAGLLHGAVAFLGVADFWRRELGAGDRVAELEFAVTAAQVRIGHRTLMGSAGDLTDAGRALAGSIGATLDELEAQPVGPAVRRVTRDIVREHRAAWQVAHLPPAEDEVLALLAGRAVAPGWERPGTVSDQPLVPSRLRQLAQRWLTHADVSGERDSAMDVAAIAGRYREAARGYAARLTVDPADVRAIAGLVVSAERLGPAPVHPQVLAQALRRTDEAGRAEILRRWTAPG